MINRGTLFQRDIFREIMNTVQMLLARVKNAVKGILLLLTVTF